MAGRVGLLRLHKYPHQIRVRYAVIKINFSRLFPPWGMSSGDPPPPPSAGDCKTE